MLIILTVIQTTFKANILLESMQATSTMYRLVPLSRVQYAMGSIIGRTTPDIITLFFAAFPLNWHH